MNSREVFPDEELRRRIMDFIMAAGQTLLENGAEVFRVEQTMEIMARSFHLREFHVYVLTNGIFASAGTAEISEVRNVPTRTTHLGRVAAVNALSREIVARGGFGPGAGIMDHLRRGRWAFGNAQALPPTARPPQDTRQCRHALFDRRKHEGQALPLPIVTSVRRVINAEKVHMNEWLGRFLVYLHHALNGLIHQSRVRGFFLGKICRYVDDNVGILVV